MNAKKLVPLVLALMATVTLAPPAAASSACTAQWCVDIRPNTQIDNSVHVCDNAKDNVVIQVGIYNYNCTNGGQEPGTSKPSGQAQD